MLLNLRMISVIAMWRNLLDVCSVERSVCGIQGAFG